MKTLPPKYTDIQLQIILDTGAQLPDNIHEKDFVTDIKSNPKI